MGTRLGKPVPLPYIVLRRSEGCWQPEVKRLGVRCRIFKPHVLRWAMPGEPHFGPEKLNTLTFCTFFLED